MESLKRMPRRHLAVVVAVVVGVVVVPNAAPQERPNYYYFPRGWLLRCSCRLDVVTVVAAT